MMSANKLLLQRLAAAPTIRRQLLGRAVSCKNAGFRLINPKSISLHLPTATTFCNAQFSSSPQRVDDEEDDVDHKEEVSPADASNAAQSEKVSSNPDEIIRTGVVKWIDFPKKCAVLIQDPQFRKISPNKRATVFVHFSEIYPEIYEEIKPLQWRIDDVDKCIKPIINKAVRFQFQAKEVKGSRDLRGFNLRYEGGGDIPMIRWREALLLIRRARSYLGHEIYFILTKVEDVNEIRRRVNAVLEQCNKRVKWAQNHIRDRETVKKECKLELGETIFDLLGNIATVDNIERRADDAYLRCLRNLSALELDFSPEVHDHSSQDFVENTSVGYRV